MCGVLGIIGPNNPINSNWVKNNISKISHRGPDNEGIWSSNDNFVVLGHTRLSIIDLSPKNNQPLKDAESKVCITFNGEIYNYVELRNELIKLGHKFNTNGDTEVLLKSYIEWKEKCFDKIEGMYAFCICDQKRNKIFLVRDQYGQKPLYFKYSNDVLKFGSELEVFLKDVDTKINIKNLNKFLYNGFVKNESLVDNLKQVPPGHYLEFNYYKKILNCTKYWELPTGNNSKFDDNEVLELIKKSLKKQLRSDVPAAFLLSGGIDSSLIVGLASEIAEKKIRTFTVSNNASSSVQESENAKIISNIYQTDHENLKIDEFELSNFFNILNKFSEPIIDSSVIPTYSIYNKIKNECKVVFGGDGGDEIFGGYNHFKNFSKLNILNNFSTNLAKKIKELLMKKKYFYQSGYMYLELLGLQKTIIDIPNYFNEIERKELFKDPDLSMDLAINKVKSDDLVIDSMKNSFSNYLPEDIMFKVDRCSMLNSIEARTPFLDKNLVSYIFKNTVGSDHLSLFNNRKIQKRISRNILPKKILDQKKRGFSFNLSHHLKKRDWKNEIYSILVNNDCIFSEKFINHLFKLNDNGYLVSEKIFGLLFFEIWRKKFKITI